VPEQHFTQPPPRFTEASLVKELERLGIGRPSTYAQIISTLLERDYVTVNQKRFQPTPLGETVARVLVRVFPDLFDVGFTSEMEAELDRIEEGELDWRGVLQQFYGPFQRQLQDGKSKSETIVREVVTGDETRTCSDCGKPMIVRWNRFGRFLGCSGYPECRHTEQLDREAAAAPKPIGEKCPQCGGEMVEREGRFGAFIACSNYPKCKFTRPKTIPGLKCPTCGQGSIGEKRTRRGKPFWGCTRYPECDWSVWDEPVARVCDVCEAPFLVKKSTKKQGDFLKCIKCSSIVAIDGATETVASAGAPGSPGVPSVPSSRAPQPPPTPVVASAPLPRGRPAGKPKRARRPSATATRKPKTAGTAAPGKGSKPQGRKPTRKRPKGK
jgi:DNA topoisomerase-1